MRPILLLGALALFVGDAAAKPKPKAKTGTIKGTVRFDGTAPLLSTDRGADPACQAGEHPERAAEVDGKGGLAGAIVYLKAGTAGKHEVPTDPVVIDQDGCEYTPRVVGLIDGQKLEIRNGDPTFHNVKAKRDGRVDFNLPQNKGAKPIVRDDLGDPGDVTSLACDVHPWMAGWVLVLDHPFFAVTAADGSFAIPDVPPGKYTLVAWHPHLGRKTTKVKLARGKKVVKATFSFDQDDCVGC